MTSPHEEVKLASAVRAAKRVQAILAEAHPQAAEIVLAQVALELQLREAAAHACGRSNRRLKLPQEDARLRKAIPDAWLGLLLDVAKAYTDARNAIAHGDGLEEVERCLGLLRDKFEHVSSRLDPTTVRYGSVAVGLAAAISIAVSEALAAP